MSASFGKFWKSGDPFIWMTGGALAFSLIMIIALIVIVAANALGFYWPAHLVQAKLKDGTELLGQIIVSEKILTPDTLAATETYRTEFQVANRDLYGADFRWLNDEDIVARSFPAEALYFERWEWGPLFGFLTAVTQDGNVIADGFAQAWEKFQEIHPRTQETLDRIHTIERKEIGDINYSLEQTRLAMKRIQTQERDPAQVTKHITALEQEIAALQRRYEEKAKELKQIVSIAVVDSGGHLFSFKRMTNGRTHNTMIALAKARSAALTTAATGKTNREGGEIPDHQVLAQTLAVGPGWFISIEGGIPLTIEGQCIAAVGVSGAPAAVDKQICQAGVDAFNKAS